MFAHVQTELDHEPRDFDFLIKKPTDRVLASSTDAPPPGRLVAAYKDPKARIFLVETDVAVTERRPYDESSITAACRVDPEDRRLRLAAPVAGYRPLEQLVAAYKHLLQRCFSDGPAGYYFARLTLSELPAGGFEVELKKVFRTFYQGEVSAAGRAFGTILFGAQAT
jgi:hypothetical protein